MPEDTHTAILDLGILLGYITKDRILGVCNGFTIAWISACMVGNEERFNRRIQYIIDEYEALPEQLIQIKEKVMRREELSDNEGYLLELLAFFEHVLLFQAPGHYIDLFNAGFSQQDIGAISKVVSSELIADKGGLCSINLSIGLYTEHEIVSYLDSITNAIDSISWPEDASLSFVLVSHDHAQGLRYIPARHCWSLMDVNQWPATYFSNTQELAQKIIAGFTFTDDITPDFTAFSTQLISTLAEINAKEAPLQQLVTQLNTINKNYSITADTVSRPGLDALIYIAARLGNLDIFKTLGALNVNLSNAVVDDKTPAYIAAEHSHSQLIKVFGEQNVDLDKSRDNGVTPAFIAAQMRNAPLIKILGEQNADLNKSRHDGITPFFIAAQIDDIPVIEELGAQKADPNKVRNDGATPCFIAAAMGHADAIRALAILKADLNKATDDGETPAFVAAEEGHFHVIQELGAHHVDFNQATNDGKTPLFIAALAGDIDIVRYLVHYPGVQQIPITESTDSLRNFSESLSLEVQQKIEEHITKKLSKGDNKKAISVTVKDIAYIMGHDEIVDILKNTKPKVGRRSGIFKMIEPIKSDDEPNETNCPSNRIS